MSEIMMHRQNLSTIYTLKIQDEELFSLPGNIMESVELGNGRSVSDVLSALSRLVGMLEGRNQNSKEPVRPTGTLTERPGYIDAEMVEGVE